VDIFVISFFCLKNNIRELQDIFKCILRAAKYSPTAKVVNPAKRSDPELFDQKS
jgi:hypothetical protein